MFEIGVRWTLPWPSKRRGGAAGEGWERACQVAPRRSPALARSLPLVIMDTFHPPRVFLGRCRMSKLQTCPQGHRWVPGHARAEADHCPVCGGDGSAGENIAELPTLAPKPALPDSAAETATVLPTGPSAEITGGPPQIPGYEILDVLGRGGMGVVYRARHIKLDRPVALKMVLAGGHASAQDLARFRTEVEAVARLRHPNVVQIYEVGEHGGLPYCALEFINGGSLSTHLNGTPVPPMYAAELVETLARAIHAAHQAGIIHRDLKPANILLEGLVIRDPGLGTPDSLIPNLQSLVPKITDFGLAKKLDSADGPTATGAVMGTPSYMAPEQAGGKGKEVGPAADIYAIGAILYELLTGRPPFKAPTPLDTIMQVVSDEPVRPRQLQPRLARDLETICLKCLEKDPRKRYAAAAELAEDLRRWQNHVPILARRIGPIGRTFRWCRRYPGIAAALAVSVLAALAIVVLSLVNNASLRTALSDTSSALDRETQAKVEANRQELQSRRYFYGADINLAQQALETGNGIRLISALERQMPKAGDVDHRTFEWHYLWRQAHRERMSLRGHTKPISRLAYSPDGTRLVTAAESELKIWDTLTGRVLQTFTVAPDSVGSLAVSPDGKTLAISLRRGAKKSPLGRSEPQPPDGQQARPNQVTNPYQVELRDMGSGERISGLKEGNDEIVALGFASDGTSLILVEHVSEADISGLTGFLRSIGTGDLQVWKWDIKKNRGVSTSLAVTGWALASAIDAALSLDATSLIACGHGMPMATIFAQDPWQATYRAEGVLLVWDTASGRSNRVFTGHSKSVTAAAISPDGRTVASWAMDQTIKLRDVESGKDLPAPTGLFRGGTSVPGQSGRLSLSPDGTVLAIAGDDASVCLWDIRAGRRLAVLLGHNSTVSELHFAPDAKTLATGGADHTVNLWDTTRIIEPQLIEFPWPKTNVLFQTLVGPRFLPGTGKFIVAQGQDIMFFDAADGKEVKRIKAFEPTDAEDSSAFPQVKGIERAPPGVTRMTVSPDGAFLATLSSSIVKIWDLRNDTPRVPFKTSSRISSELAFTPDGKSVIAGDKVWEVGTWIEQPDQAKLGLTDAVAFTSDGRRFVTIPFEMGSKTHRVMLRETQDGAVCFEHRIQEEPRCALSPDGTMIALGSNDGTVDIWNPEIGAVSLVLRGHTGPILQLAFASDGRTLATACSDGTVKLWAPHTGQERLTLRQDGYTPANVIFAPDLSALLVNWSPRDVFDKSKSLMLALYQAAPAKPHR